MALTHSSFLETLESLDGNSYPAYKDLRHTTVSPDDSSASWELRVLHIQGDPPAAPSRFSFCLGAEQHQLPPSCCRSPSRATGTAHYLGSLLSKVLKQLGDRRGSGKSGRFSFDAPTQQVLRRTSVQLQTDGELQIRFAAGLPAYLRVRPRWTVGRNRLVRAEPTSRAGP